MIVHPAAQVNHLLPYDQLFGPNVRGTAEVLGLASARRLKKVVFLSTIGVADQLGGRLAEDDDIRAVNPVRTLSEAYASGYATSKWAAEVLLRDAHDRCGLPVTVFRSGLILAHPRYAGQLNLPDTLTRMVLSLLVTGVAPRSFAPAGARPAALGGLPVDVVARSVVGLGTVDKDRDLRTFHAVDPDPDGPTLDTVVDWLIEGGAPITRIDDHAEWLRRFEIGLRGAPERVAAHSALPLLDAFRRPRGASSAPPSASRFAAAVRDTDPAGVPTLSRDLIAKYTADLAALSLLDPGTTGHHR